LASMRVAEKIGMTKEKECEQHNLRYCVYSLSRSAESGHKQ
jgi:RimJ/RimL family protein N-acetyltransferase